jgi:hypothetical protein
MPFFSLTNLNKQFRKVLNYINFWSNTNLGLSTIFLEIIELQKKNQYILKIWQYFCHQRKVQNEV